MPDLNEMYRQMLGLLTKQEDLLAAELEEIRSRKATIRNWLNGVEGGGSVSVVSLPTSNKGGESDVPHRPGTADDRYTADGGEDVGGEREDDDAEDQDGTTLSIAAAGEAALRIAGRHLRPRQIRDTIVANRIKVNAKPERLTETVGAVLARRASEGKVFAKASPGLYGLKEWNGLGPYETEDQLRAAAGEVAYVGTGL